MFYYFDTTLPQNTTTAQDKVKVQVKSSGEQIFRHSVADGQRLPQPFLICTRGPNYDALFPLTTRDEWDHHVPHDVRGVENRKMKLQLAPPDLHQRTGERRPVGYHRKT